jgi:drug/metabolite transporter (DMT)-like permease
MLIGVSFVWGINFSVVKTALTDFFPLSFNSIRFSLASLFILMLLWVLERDLSFRREDMGRLVLLGLIGNTTYQLLYIHGIARTTASNSSLILATTPIFVALLSSALRVERVERKVWQSVVISFIGILLITQGVGGDANHEGSELDRGSSNIDGHNLLVYIHCVIQATTPTVFSS